MSLVCSVLHMKNVGCLHPSLRFPWNYIPLFLFLLSQLGSKSPTAPADAPEGSKNIHHILGGSTFLFCIPWTETLGRDLFVGLV